MVRAIGAAVALSFAGSALALPQGSFWVEVPIVDSGTDASNLTGYRCFRLFVQLQAGDTFTAADFGIAGPNTGVSTDGVTFSHAFGDASNLPPNPAFIPVFPDLAWDSFVGIADLPASGLGVAQGISLVGPGAFIGAWFDQPMGLVPMANGPTPNSWFLAQITVNPPELRGGALPFLGGQVFVSGTGPNGQFGGLVPLTGVVNVPNAFVPSPGALALFGLAGLGATRRRR